MNMHYEDQPQNPYIDNLHLNVSSFPLQMYICEFIMHTWSGMNWKQSRAIAKWLRCN